MKLVSVNVGKPRVVETARGSIVTSIFKDAVEGRRRIVPHNVVGDRQADLTVHGGPKKAVYGYAQEHYGYWENRLDGKTMAAGMFGENLTIEGLLEAEIHIGDVVEIGTARLRVTQPRMPCVKLAIRFNLPSMVKQFWESRRSGVYFALEREGEVGAGDEVRIAELHPLRVSVADVVHLYQDRSEDRDLYERTMASPLAGSWREGILERWTQRQP